MNWTSRGETGKLMYFLDGSVGICHLLRKVEDKVVNQHTALWLEKGFLTKENWGISKIHMRYLFYTC